MSKNIKITVWVTCIIIVLIIIFTHSLSTSSTPPSQEKSLTDLQTSEAPWEAELTHLRDRLTAINLPALTEEGTALHTHQHIDIFVHGTAVPVPAYIGVNETELFISPIHTHDTTGIIHVESPTIQKFTLGQFFDIWGVAFSKNSIGGYTADATSTLAVYVNGKKFEGDPRSIELTAHEEIVVTYGSPKELPKIPENYTFPEGL